MALNKALLEQSILGIFNKLATETTNPELSRQNMAKELANVIHDYVTSGEVRTTVTGSSPSGAVAGTGIGTIV